MDRLKAIAEDRFESSVLRGIHRIFNVVDRVRLQPHFMLFERKALRFVRLIVRRKLGIRMLAGGAISSIRYHEHDFNINGPLEKHTFSASKRSELERADVDSIKAIFICALKIGCNDCIKVDIRSVLLNHNETLSDWRRKTNQPQITQPVCPTAILIRETSGEFYPDYGLSATLKK